MMKNIILSIVLLGTILQAEEVYATFTIEAKKSANLAFIATGIVGKVNVEIGSVVKKDEILAILQNRDTRAMLDVAKSTFKYAKKDLIRQEKVKKLIDAGKFDAVNKNYESAKGTLAYQEAVYAKTFLKAPFDGVIYDKEVEVGDAVSGQALRTVLKIQSLSERKIVLSFDQKYHDRVKVGQTFSYKIDGDEQTYSGTLSKVYPYADHGNRKIRAEVKAKDFMVGLFGDGMITVPDAEASSIAKK